MYFPYWNATVEYTSQHRHRVNIHPPAKGDGEVAQEQGRVGGVDEDLPAIVAAETFKKGWGWAKNVEAAHLADFRKPVRCRGGKTLSEKR